tara:strand:- start:165 stop:1211 length:1047 start_codon:yes stop_codon:yes gene_type:complete
MAQINKPSLHFNSILYTGDGSSTQGITGVGFQPDWVWLKARSSAKDHMLFDVVRGVQKSIRANTDAAEDTGTDYLTAFGTDGFTLGGNGKTNGNGTTYVAWNWKAANSQGSSNTNGSINTTYTSVNTTAGFSISKYVGNYTAGATVGHGLSSAPKLMFIKNLSTGGRYWYVYHQSLGNNSELYLNAADGAPGSTGAWETTSPTNQVFTIGDHNGVNQNSNDHIAYCFEEKKGFSRFGKYIGNGNNNGAFVYTGFRPGWVMIKKNTGGENWWIFDSQRSASNVTNDGIIASGSQTEYADNNTFKIDILSNGFKVRNSDSALNSTNGTYIFISFAENPLVGTNKIPTVAR